MASLPPRQPGDTNPHNLSTAGNIAQATSKVNRFAKRDPSLYPLAFIVTGFLGAAGYFFMNKGTQPDAQRRLVASGMVHPWDDASKHDTHPSATAAFKYRHKTREGHWEDALPPMNQDPRTISSSNLLPHTNIQQSKEVPHVKVRPLEEAERELKEVRDDKKNLFGFHFEWSH